MRIVVAPDSFKGSVSAVEAARAMETGILAVFGQATVIKLPIADGGEGTVEALCNATGGRFFTQRVSGPLGEKTDAGWGVLGDGKTAVIEMAAASGLPLLAPEQRDPRRTSSFGTGELVKAALDKGLRRIIMGIGGSATNDGGAGFASALGVRFLDDKGKVLPPGGAALSRLAHIDPALLDPRAAELEIVVACDVDNPLCGPRGASHVFGPQKGATRDMARRLDEALAHYAHIAEKVMGRNVAESRGAGAAGGLGAGLLLFTGAVLRPGIDIVFEILDVERAVRGASLVVTGEGRSDGQTVYGKAPVGVAGIAKKYNVPVICVSGGLGQGHEKMLQHGVDAVFSCPPAPMTLEECMNGGQEMIAGAVERLCRVLKVGMGLAGGMGENARHML